MSAAGAAAPEPQAGTKAETATSLVGILDQRGDSFVLADQKRLRTEATLRAEGFHPDNFARFNFDVALWRCDTLHPPE